MLLTCCYPELCKAGAVTPEKQRASGSKHPVTVFSNAVACVAVIRSQLPSSTFQLTFMPKPPCFKAPPACSSCLPAKAGSSIVEIVVLAKQSRCCKRTVHSTATTDTDTDTSSGPAALLYRSIYSSMLHNCDQRGEDCGRDANTHRTRFNTHHLPSASAATTSISLVPCM